MLFRSSAGPAPVTLMKPIGLIASDFRPFELVSGPRCGGLESVSPPLAPLSCSRHLSALLGPVLWRHAHHAPALRPRSCRKLLELSGFCSTSIVRFCYFCCWPCGGCGQRACVVHSLHKVWRGAASKQITQRPSCGRGERLQRRRSAPAGVARGTLQVFRRDIRARSPGP